jgi:hypothetical protein
MPAGTYFSTISQVCAPVYHYQHCYVDRRDCSQKFVEIQHAAFLNPGTERKEYSFFKKIMLFQSYSQPSTHNKHMSLEQSRITYVK